MIYVGFGFELVSLIAAAAYLGSILEARYPAKGLIIVGCVILAFSAWITRIVLWSKKKENQ